MTSPEERPGEQSADFLAKLFDIRSFTGALFVIFGVIVAIVGLNASDADIQKSAGLNLALLIGPIMFVFGAIFIVWLLLKPPELLHSHGHRGGPARATPPPRTRSHTRTPRRTRVRAAAVRARPRGH